MAYCEITDIKSKLPAAEVQQLIDDTGTETELVKDARITAAILAADKIIDSYCGQKYTVPFSSTPAVIKNISIDLSIWELASRRWGMLEAPAMIKTNKDNAMSLLKDISKGSAIISVPAPLKNPKKVGSTLITSDSRILSRDSLKGLL